MKALYFVYICLLITKKFCPKIWPYGKIWTPSDTCSKYLPKWANEIRTKYIALYFYTEMNCPRKKNRRVGESLKWTKVPSYNVNEAQEDTKSMWWIIKPPLPLAAYTWLYLLASLQLFLYHVITVFSVIFFSYFVFIIKHESDYFLFSVLGKIS